MGKLLASAASGLFAIMAILTMGQPAWGQNRICDQSSNPNACDRCYTNAGDDKQAICECGCKWFTPKDMSKPECMAEVCGTESGGVGSKIGAGPVFRGEVFESTADALAAANDFVIAHDLQDNV